MIRLTVLVSFSVTLLQYWGVIAWIAQLTNPFFNLIGLPGEAALVFISGYFVNLYSAIAIMVTLEISLRSVTILAVMCLCAHNMIVETAVQKKTGSSAWRMVLLRTFYAIASAFILNWLLPINNTNIAMEHATTFNTFGATLQAWAFTTAKLIAKMLSIIIALNILQKLLSAYGIIKWLSNKLRWLMTLFGLPARTSFLWIVANTLGLAYGAAVMIEETEQGKISQEDADLLNHHVALSHSNLEDVILFYLVGASLGWMLILRWLFAAIAVWTRRLELMYVRKS